jgi:hypothetical protein
MRNLVTGILVGCVTAGLSAPPALAEPWTILIYETPAQIELRADKGDKGLDYWNAYRDFGSEAGSAGVLKGGGVLHPRENAATVRLVAGKAVTSPPHDADKDLKLGGYFVIDVPDMAAAVEWASKVPAASTGQVEIRSGFAAPGM